MPPVVLALTISDYKYTITRYPPSICGLQNGKYMYFSTALPLNIVIMAGCMMLVGTWHKVHTVRERERERERETERERGGKV